MARVLACGWRGLGGGWRLCNRDSTPRCIARLVFGDAFCLGDDRTDVHGRDAFGPVGDTISPGSRAKGECGDHPVPGTSVARSPGTSVQHPRGDQPRRWR
jgi:hypothetical protein